MAIALALLTAACFGIADFCGGLAAQRARVLQVVAGSHLVGAVGATAAALALADRFAWGDVALGGAGGLAGVVGVALLYRRLAAGPMTVVAPLTAITSAVVPAAWGLLDGDRLTAIGWAGLVLALLAVLLVSLSPDGPGNRAPVTAAVIVESLLAGVGFGAMFIFFDATSADAAPWPVAAARILTATLLLVVLGAGTARAGGGLVPEPPARHAWGLIALVGLLDTVSNVTFLYAASLGQLAVVSVLSALYPVSTVILARIVLAERVTRAQGLGFVAALAGTELLVLG